jgi:predicted nuclease of restriction endonuclease-like (RecB) superfamily
MLEKNFVEIIQLIKQAQNRAVRAVNAELINLYWNVGKYINDKLVNSSWGEKMVDELADFIQKNYPELKGFNRRGLYRMRQFYETYVAQELASQLQLQIGSNQNSEIVSAVGTQFADIRNSLLAKLSWTHHRTIFSRCKSAEEIEFYLRTSIKENYTARELDRQISASFLSEQ